jgi:hypothetical protein
MAIGTTAALIGASAVSAVAGASSASKAANAQENAASNDIAFQRETRDLIFDRYAPFYDSGQNALAAYNFELGLGPRPTFGGSNTPAPTVEEIAATPARGYMQGGSEGNWVEDPGTPASFNVGDRSFATREEAESYARSRSTQTPGQAYRGFTATPGYQFRVNQGRSAVDASAAARGGLNSGRTLQDLTAFGQGIASQEYGNYMNRLAGLSDGGMAAAGGQAGAATNAAAGTSNALAGIGNARAAGAIGVGNAFQGGIQNALGAWQYQSALGSQPGVGNSPLSPGPWKFGAI